jgi:hypothetical protein
MIPLMKRNLSKNAASLKGAHSAKAFEWGSDISSIVPNSNKGFHIVLAADCIYYKEVISNLELHVRPQFSIFYINIYFLVFGCLC